MAYHPMLKRLTATADNFRKILHSFSRQVQTVSDDEFKEYIHGYDNSKTIIYNGENTLIATDLQLAVALKRDTKKHPITCWKQFIVQIGDTDEILEDDVSGGYSYQFIYDKINNYYTDSEIDAILKSYTNEYNEHKKQYHYVNFDDGYSVYKNCYKYDINGAHADALCEIFPKAATDLINVRKLKMGKKYLNYFVGMLKKKGYENCYNYIVQRTSAKLLEAIRKVDGRLLYANTDGFLVTDAKNELATSKTLGEFKLEFKGTVYSYVDKNYFLFELNNKKHDKTGSCLTSVRDLSDLKHRKVIHYDRKKDEFGVTYAANIIEEQL